jgi:hypothetical protein
MTTFIYLFILFIYSYVHTLFGPFLSPPPPRPYFYFKNRMVIPTDIFPTKILFGTISIF